MIDLPKHAAGEAYAATSTVNAGAVEDHAPAGLFPNGASL